MHEGRGMSAWLRIDGGADGCTVNLVQEEAVEAFISKLHAEYLKASGKEADSYISFISKDQSSNK